jgi:hypothetical protein
MTFEFVSQSESAQRSGSLLIPKPSGVFKRRCLLKASKKHPDIP